MTQDARSHDPTVQISTEDYCWQRRHELIYKARLSILYHLARERFFDRVDKGISIITAVAATSAVGAVLGSGTGYQVASVITAVLALIPLVFNPGAAARHHGKLASEFRRLRADFERAGEHWSTKMCDEMSAKAAELEATEPAVLCALVAHCQNQLNVGNGGPVTRLTKTQKQLMHVVSFDAADLVKQ